MKRETETREEEKYVLLRSGQMFNISCCQTVNNIDQIDNLSTKRRYPMDIHICIYMYT